MMLTRERIILMIVAALIVALGAYSAYAFFGPGSEYRGLTTHIDVQMDESTRTYLEQQLSTAQAAIVAQKRAGEEIDLDLYASIASTAYILGDLVTAREALEAELEGNPLNYNAWSSYGTVLEAMGDYVGARQAYEKAIALSETDAPENFFNLLVTLLQTHFEGEHEAVKEALERSIEIRGQTSWNMVELGRWYLARGDCEGAIDHYKVAKTLAPQNTNIARELQEIQSKCQ